MPVVVSAAIAASSAIACAVLIVLMRPWLMRYSLAQPNARSSHKTPTPQGGGFAVVIAASATAAGTLLFVAQGGGSVASIVTLLIAVLWMVGVGVAADLHAIDAGPRLVLQAMAVAAVIFALPTELRTMPELPFFAERTLLVVGGLWFVNLVNFMDGLDWMTAAEVIPVTATIAAIGLLGLLPPQVVIVSLAMCGAMIGFAYFNRPVARLFLGDVGSLPIGLVLGWMLIEVAGHGGRAAAVVLPLYYVADSTITVLRRLMNGERIWQAHRTHFYQRATDRGYSVPGVVTRVFAVNLALGALALATVIVPGRICDAAALVAGAGLVAWLLAAFARGAKPGLDGTS